jgi:hypothetical protein
MPNQPVPASAIGLPNEPAFEPTDASLELSPEIVAELAVITRRPTNV